MKTFRGEAVMGAISTATSYACDISSLLLSNSSDTSAAADSSTSASPAAPDASSSGDDRGPATNVQLSDKVKSILAKANSDAVVARRLQTFVQSSTPPARPMVRRQARV